MGDRNIFSSPILETSQSRKEASTTITINESSSNDGGSSQPGFGATGTPTLATIIINSNCGTSITLNPTSATTICSGSTSITITPTSGTPSTSRPGNILSPSVFPPPQATTFFNGINSQTQPVGTRGGLSLFNPSQSYFRPWFDTGFGVPHEPPQFSFCPNVPSPSVQNGIWGSLIPRMDLREFIKLQTDVAMELTRQLLLIEGNDRNVVYSPLSIYVVLSMIAAGSEEGDTLTQMLMFLKSKSTGQLNGLASDIVPLVFADGSPCGGPSLSFANGFWMEESLIVKASFKQILHNEYKAALKQVDFKNKYEEARCEVNSWALKETKGLIKDLIPRGKVDRNTRLILANALYFKGAWDQNFKGARTKMLDFYLLNGKSVEAPFMTSWNSQYIGAYDGFKVLRLPYKQGEDKTRRFSMYIFLPHARDGLSGLVERVCSESRFLDYHLPNRKVAVNYFYIPKFKISTGFEAVEVLETLGQKMPILSETVENQENLNVTSMHHKSFIEVNEDGTEAAAALCTSCSCAGPLPEIERIDFVADHPFLFLIREEATGAMLFIGHVLDPMAN